MAKQVTEQQVEQLIEGIIDKMQKANELFLTNIGEKIKKIRELKPSEAHKLIQILKYGGNYEDIINKISKVSQISINKLDEMFKAYSIKDTKFAEDFYKYRDIPFAKYNQNSQLKAQTEAIANMAKKEMYDFTRNNVLGYTVRDNKGVEIFKGLRQVYNDLLDEAFINVGQGKETFDGAMRKVLKDIGQSGLKSIDYKSGRAVRLDSTIRMHLKNKLNELHNENQVLFGSEFDSDGVEISVHEYPAPDHEEVQGRQFSNEEYDKLQGGSEAKDYKGNTYTLDHDGNGSYRPISEMNCYHTIFSIILGVSEPEYTDEQLKQIQKRNDEQFEFDGKLYNKYEGTQLQRAIEREIRKQKDIQILAKASDNKELMADAQERITILNYKYKDLCDQSGLPSKKNRMKVSGYQRTAINRTDNSRAKPIADLLGDALDNKERSVTEWKEYFGEKYGSYDAFQGKVKYDRNKTNYIEIKDNLENVDKRLLNRNMEQFDYLLDKYDITEYHGIEIEISDDKDKNYIGWTRFNGTSIKLGNKYFIDRDKLLEVEKRCQNLKWHNVINEKDLDIYTITHEYGHVIEDTFMQEYIIQDYMLKKTGRITREEVDSMIRNDIMSNVVKKTGLTRTEIRNKYFSGYANSKRNFEWFAEGFANIELGEPNPFTEELEIWIKENLK